MAKTAKITRVVGNRGAFGSPSRKKSYKKRARPARRNSGEILAYTIAGSNPGRKANMAKTKKNYRRKPGTRKNYRKNTGERQNTHHGHTRHGRRNTGQRTGMGRYHRPNPGTASVGEIITTSTFVLVGALGSKLGAQLILGTNNTGPVGYAGNLAVGAGLWLITDKVMKNKTAASGVIAGTVAALILRLLNDYTPIGTYIQNLGMGDYQMQSYVQPQILVDPLANADVQIPPGWGPQQMLAAAPAASTPSGKTTKMPAAKGTGDLYDAGNWGGGDLY